MKYFFVACVLLSLLAHSRCESQLHDPSKVHDKEHIMDHMNQYMEKEDIDSLKLDSSEAMEFHYFKLHDYDNNNKLDGLELAAALTHFHDGGSDEKHQAITIDDEELASLVEQILKDDDLNDDGYIDYYEFIQAQRRSTIPQDTV